MEINDKRFLMRTKLKKDQNLLEIGCGSGAFLVIAKISINYYGFDYNQIKIAKKALPNITKYSKQAN